MAKSKNLELTLTDDSTIKFKEWRETQNGVGGTTKSNAEIIDDFAGIVNTKLKTIVDEDTIDAKITNAITDVLAKEF